MNREALMHQLISIRAAVDACLAHLAEEHEKEAQRCTHPVERLENLTVMGGPVRYRCKDCGELIEGEP